MCSEVNANFEMLLTEMNTLLDAMERFSISHWTAAPGGDENRFENNLMIRATCSAPLHLQPSCVMEDIF